ncbi:MAG: LAGLIDADG family homing endonuclease [Candidatus Woesearchaeota archaeon]
MSDEYAEEITAAEQIDRFKEFFEATCKARLLENIRQGKKRIVLPFEDLAKFDPELATILLEDPENTLRVASSAVEQLEGVKEFMVRFADLPPTQQLDIRNLRAEHLGQFIQITGVVRQKTDVRPQVTTARFECPSCGNVITVLQLDTKFREPNGCGQCGRKGRFRLMNKELVDAQKIVLEEAPDDLDGGEQPKRLNVFLYRDLVAPMTDRQTNPGSKVTVVGYTKEVPVLLSTGGQSTRFDLVLETNFIEPKEEDYSQINITPEEEAEIFALANDSEVFTKLCTSLAPSIYGHDKIKEAIILQLLGGVKKSRSDGNRTRGDMHILMVGDPGSGKSQLLKRSQVVAPKSRFVSGKGASGAGLCVAPKSLVCENPGGISTIESVVERVMPTTKQEFRPGVWKQDNVSSLKIQSMKEDLKLRGQPPASVWRLQAPKYMRTITTSSGKRVEITTNTKLLVLEDGLPTWKKSSSVQEGDYIATPRKLIGGNNTTISPIELFSANPVVHGVEALVKKIKSLLINKYGSVRKAAKHHGINENQLYFHWVNKTARGTIKLEQLRTLAKDVGVEYKPHISSVSLYNGKPHLIPQTISKDFLYVFGLLLGDGDIRKTQNSISVRLSSSTPRLLKIYQDVLLTEWGLSCDVQPATTKRPAAARTSSKLLGQTLLSLGAAFSPKSTKIFFSEHILHLTNEYLAHAVAGLYDADGWVHHRAGKGSSQVGFVSTSETLVRQLQLILLRWGIHSRARKRPKTSGAIVGKHARWVLEITNTKDISVFAKHIPLRHPTKKQELQNIISSTNTLTSRLERLPGVSQRLKPLLQEAGISLKKVGWHPSLSRTGLQRLLEATSEFRNKEDFVSLAYKDVHWEVVCDAQTIAVEYEHVYDFTVQDAHNFVVDGILVHNTASVVKDEFMRGWALEAGALVLANKGFAMIDELDKMSDEDRSAFHEALEQQQVTISKANIQATLRCETVVLAAANPKFGRFDPYELLAKQIELPSTLINRFDLIFPVRDLPNLEKDKKMADFILRLHQTGDVEQVPVRTELLTKYVSYARSKVFPTLTDEALKEIRDFYVDMRNTGSGEEAISAIPISARQLEALVRLTEASARSRLSKKATREDARRAIDLVMYCLQQLGVDPDTGKMDIDRLTTGVTASTRNHVHTIKQIIRELAELTGESLVSEEEILAKAAEKNIDEAKAEEVLERLNRMGDIFRPRPGFYSMMK